MASPDLKQYVDLTIYDKDTQDIYEMAVSVIQNALPEWKPEEGHTEVVLIEALAQEVMETIYAINRLPGAIVQTLLQLYGVTRAEGAQPTTTIRVFLSDSYGHDIAAGTRFMLNLGEGVEPVIFSSNIGVVVPPGSTYADVAATGDRFTDEANGIVSGEIVDLLDAIPYVDYAALQSTVTGGMPEETDDKWLDRGVTRLSRLVDTLTLPSHFTAAALEHGYVTRATTLDNFDSTAGSGTPGSHPGHVTVAVYGNNESVASADKTALDVEMEAKSLANLEVHITDPTINTVNITASIMTAPGYTDAQAIAAAQAALVDGLSPAKWDWSTTLYKSDIIAIMAKAPGVLRVTSVTAPAADVTLTGVAPLVKTGTLTITAV